MAKFSFNLPNGKLFTLEAPAGTTAVEAERVYLEQLAAGAFIGLSSGDSLQSVETTVTEFAKSRLTRGTAGVPDIPLLAIYTDGFVSGSSVANATPTGTVTIISSLPTLADVPINNGITVSEYVETSVVTTPIGPLSATQVQAVMAAVAASVCQPANLATSALGVGKYGFDINQLEGSGHIKCGTALRYAPTANNAVDLLKSPSVWTGKDGVIKLDDLLTNSELQDKIQLGIMKDSYTKLVQTGEIVTPGTDAVAPSGQIYNATTGELSSVQAAISSLSTASLSGLTNSLDRGIAALGGLLAISSKFSVDNALAWAKGQIPTINSASIKSQMDSLAKQGQFAVNFSDFKLPAAVAGVIPAAGFSKTIDRTTVNAAFTKLVGSTKIPTPTFSPQAVDTSALQAAGQKAKSLLSGSIPSGLGGLSGLSSGLDDGFNSLGDPNAPPYTGNDPVIRQRLGLPPVDAT